MIPFPINCHLKTSAADYLLVSPKARDVLPICAVDKCCKYSLALYISRVLGAYNTKGFSLHSTLFCID